MNNKPIKSKMCESLQKVRSSSGLVTLKHNRSFCNKIFDKSKIACTVDEANYFGEPKNLVYDTSRSAGLNSELFGTIIDLLLQLRAAQDDQNVIVQNNTVIREQILNQLKNEIFRISHKLTKKQIKDLEVVSSDSFDPKTLTDILNSFLESSKKKSNENNFLADNIYLKHKILNINLEKTFANYRKIIGEVSLHENVYNPLVIKRTFNRDLISPAVPKEESKEKSLIEKTNEEIYHEILEDPSVVKLIKKDKRILKSINHIYENSIVNKSGIILPIIKLHSRISEIKILNKTKTFFERILDKTIHKSLPSVTDLVNKVVSKTQINELRENVIQYKEQYLNEQAGRKREIKNLYSEVKKLHSSKRISQAFTEFLKSNKVSSLNIENLVKKSLNKFVYQNNRISKHNIISENTSHNSYYNKNIIRNKLTNKALVYKDFKSENQVIYDQENITKNIINNNKKLLSKINQKDIITTKVKNKFENSRFLILPKDEKRTNFKNISETVYQDVSYDNKTSNYKLINKNLLYRTKVYDRKEIQEKTNLNRSVINTNNKLIKDIHENNVFIKDFRNKYNSYKILFKHNDEINKENSKHYNFKKVYIDLTSQNLREYLNLDTEKQIHSYKKLYSEVSKNLFFKNNIKVYDILKLNKIKFGIKEKVNHDFIVHNNNLIINKFEKELINKVKRKVTYNNVDKFKYLEYQDKNLDKVNFFQKIINHASEKILNQSQIFKNLKDIHYMQQKDIIIKNQKKFIEDLRVFHFPEKLSVSNFADFEKLGAIKIFKTDNSKDIYVDKSHIVYKENVKPAKEEIKQQKKEEISKIKEEPDIIIKEKPKNVYQNDFDVKAIEKRVMANTLGKKEIEELIKSHIGEIDIESISKIVIGKIERKILIDRKRSGIF